MRDFSVGMITEGALDLALGDTLLVTASGSDPAEAETVTVTDATGTRVGLRQALQSPHSGMPRALDVAGTLVCLLLSPHACFLSQCHPLCACLTIQPESSMIRKLYEYELLRVSPEK